MKNNRTFLEWIITFKAREWILFTGIVSVILCFLFTYLIVFFKVEWQALAILHGALGLILLMVRGMIAVETHY